MGAARFSDAWPLVDFSREKWVKVAGSPALYAFPPPVLLGLTMAKTSRSPPCLAAVPPQLAGMSCRARPLPSSLWFPGPAGCRQALRRAGLQRGALLCELLGSGWGLMKWLGLSCPPFPIGNPRLPEASFFQFSSIMTGRHFCHSVYPTFS